MVPFHTVTNSPALAFTPLCRVYFPWADLKDPVACWNKLFDPTIVEFTVAESANVPFSEIVLVTIRDPVICAVPVKGKGGIGGGAIADEAVVYNCPDAVSIITTFDCAVDVNPFKNTDPDVVKDPDTMGWNIFIFYAICVTVTITEGVAGLDGDACVPFACSCPWAVVFEYFNST